jgi:hypothetical protein
VRGLSSLPESYRRDRAWFGVCLARAHPATGNVEAAGPIALEVAPDAVAVDNYAWCDLGKVAKTLRAVRCWP